MPTFAFDYDIHAHNSPTVISIHRDADFSSKGLVKTQRRPYALACAMEYCRCDTL